MKIKINNKIITLNIILIFIIIKNKYLNFSYIKNGFNISLNTHYNYINYNDSIYFNIADIIYIFSIKYNIAKINYKISIIDKNKNEILPSDLTLFNNIHVICIIKNVNEQFEINSFPHIYQNKYYECIEFININETIKMGILIYKTKEKEVKNESIQRYYFVFKNNIYKSLIKNDIENFDPLLLRKKYIRLSQMFNNININESLRLKKSYVEFPINYLKSVIAIYENEWYFKNINNIYFCFCKGCFCLMDNNYKKCKYKMYLNIIDNNRKVYNKEHYFFLDFILSDYSSDDVFPIFKTMLKDKKPVHYMTENSQLYNEYCYKKAICFDIIYVNKQNFTINENFLEKYLTLILKLKQVISGVGTPIFYKDTLFYNIEYIIYICVGHGVSYFKYFLYDSYNWYGYKKFDKILVPPSNILLSVVKNHGWKEENIIKINLPRWDKYNFNYFYKNDSLINNNSIFIMFTWRKLKRNKKVSIDYFKNIFNLINNLDLSFYLKSNHIVLYFTLHHKLNKFIYTFSNNIYIKFIKETMISDCLSKTNLVISDFSSIIFDIIYRRKPYIMYIPDAYDKEIENIYHRTYYDVIQSLINGSIYFENKYFNISQVINKIKYYIDNKFMLEPKLEKFYDLFELKKGNNTNNFIKYITCNL